MNLTKKDTGRFLEKFDIGKENDCWEWKASKNKDGYGKFWAKGKHLLSHRVSYAYFIENIPNGLFVLHSCDNPSCVNPKHLRVGTHSDNMKDRHDRSRYNVSGKNNPMYGKTVSDETRNKISKSLRGEKHYFVGKTSIQRNDRKAICIKTR